MSQPSEIRSVATHAAESGHWYDKDGNQVLLVKGSKGQDVKPDLRHARKLQLAPGVTTIIGCANKPQLEVWKQQQVLMCALTLTRMPAETDAEFIARIMADSKRQAEEAAAHGSAIHAQVETAIGRNAVKLVEERASLDGYEPNVQSALMCLHHLGGRAGWVAEAVCVSAMGYGTKSDAHTPLPPEGTTGWVVDIKTKDGNLDDVTLYDEHLMQLAATSRALGMPQARCAILFVSRTHANAYTIEATREQLDRGWEMFQALLAYWIAKNNYCPDWADGAL